MLEPKNPWCNFHNLGVLIRNWVSFIMAFIGIVIGIPEEYVIKNEWNSYIVIGVEKIHEYGLHIYCSLVIFLLIGYIFSSRPDSWVVEQIQLLLDDYQKKAFNENGSQPQHHHRVTLFKRSKFKFFLWGCGRGTNLWPWGESEGPRSGWIFPYMRSGHTTKISKTIFLAPDDADKAEGIAGRAWSCNNTIIVTDLPNIQEVSSDENKRKYCAKTFINTDYLDNALNNNKTLSRSFAAFPIEVDNEVWGSVVLDSRDKNGVTSDCISNFTIIIGQISRLLEKL